MSQVELSRVQKTYGAFVALKDIDLTLPSGGLSVIIGPSGCGKSTLLRTIAGLETITSGELRIGGRRVNERSPSERQIAMVFQSYALYPHMTVLENMSFGLRFAGNSKTERNAKVAKTAATLGLTELLSRYPRQLSGGQRQRVAIGRAIVRQPAVFLFDEPLSNLDASLRVSTRLEILKLYERLQTTTVYVTHDQVEAMTLATQIVVLRDGRVEQVGSPRDLYDRPANRFVAGFIGSPSMNFFDARVERSTSGAELLLFGSGATTLASPLGLGGQRGVTVGIRPEHLAVSNEESDLIIEACVDVIEWFGDSAVVYASSSAGPVVMRCAPDLRLSRGDNVRLGARIRDVHVFDAQGQRMNKH